jgi:rod shape determining protein RodA
MQLNAQRLPLQSVPWGVVGAALLTGLVGIYNLASAARPQTAALPGSISVGLGSVANSQAAYLGLGLIAVVVVAAFDYRFIQRMVVPIYLLNLAALIALKFVGVKAKGAESWFAIGPLRLQPAEFMKIGMVLMMAKYFHDDHRPQEPAYGFQRFIQPAVIALVPTGLVLVQPDLGTAMMMTFTAVTLMAFARPKMHVVAVAGVCFLAGVGVLWNDWVRVQHEGPRQTVIRHLMKPHQEARISGWLDPTSDLKGSNYHSMQSKIAVGSGGVLGKGWKEGTQTGLRYLPEQHTDFIFSVWAEEQGFLACLGLLILYGALLLGSLSVAFYARDRFGAFVAVGIAAMIFWQVFENIGMVTGLLPVTGITLPLMSYGGSSMVSVMIGIGLLVNIGMRRHIFR